MILTYSYTLNSHFTFLTIRAPVAKDWRLYKIPRHFFPSWLLWFSFLAGILAKYDLLPKIYLIFTDLNLKVPIVKNILYHYPIILLDVYGYQIQETHEFTGRLDYIEK